MKKTYIEPTMVVAKLPTRRMLLTSLRAGADWSSGEAGAREFDVDEEDF